MTDRQQKLNKNMDTLFPQTRSDLCRVCDEPVVDGRWNYCSERCREIANAVQRMFLWTTVRDQVLERDDYTCQECDLTRDLQTRAYWQTRELVDEETADTDDSDAWLECWERYGDLEQRVMEVDHIERIADGGHPLDESNLQTLCEYCHEAKTADENSGPPRETVADVTLADYLDLES